VNVLTNTASTEDENSVVEYFPKNSVSTDSGHVAENIKSVSTDFIGEKDLAWIQIDLGEVYM
jgi:hypothetical protein